MKLAEIVTEGEIRFITTTQVTTGCHTSFSINKNDINLN